MCAIGGILNFINERKVNGDILKKMMDIVIHRGPDDEGFYLEDNLGLGVRRLSIIDLTKGHQPIYNEDKSVCIVFNGEIYNYKELRSFLITNGHSFYTNTDVETIVHLYEKYGEDCLKKLKGMFAFALWDKKKEKLLLVRDRLGIKPLYYSVCADTLIFGSEIKSLLEYEKLERKVDFEALDHYLSFRYVPGPKTMLRGINKLLPGQALRCQGGKISLWSYWDLDFIQDQAFNKSESYYAEKLLKLLKASVKLSLRSDVPVGVLLSGGLDSSTILALLSQIGQRKIKTFSIGFSEGDSYNELNYARIVAKRFDAVHREVTIGLKEFVESIPKIIWHMDEPIADPSAIPLYHVAGLASKEVKVVFSGEGGDEIFSGYNVYTAAFDDYTRWKYLQKIPSFIRERLLTKCLKYFPDGLKGKSLLRRAFLPLEKRYLGVSVGFQDEEKQKLYSSDFRRGKNLTSPYEFLTHYYNKVKHANILNQMLYLDTKVWLPDDLLVKADKTTMAHSLELRVPFLNHNVVEFGANIPANLKLKNGITKYIYKKSVANLLPELIINRKKMGLPVPLGVWFDKKMRRLCSEVLLDQRAVNRGYFNINYIKELINNHNSQIQSKNYSFQLWTLLNFELWQRIFIDSMQPDEITLNI